MPVHSQAAPWTAGSLSSMTAATPIGFELPALRFVLVAAAGLAMATAALLWGNRPASGCDRVRRRTIQGLLVVAALCVGAVKVCW